MLYTCTSCIYRHKINEIQTNSKNETLTTTLWHNNFCRLSGCHKNNARMTEL